MRANQLIVTGVTLPQAKATNGIVSPALTASGTSSVNATVLAWGKNLIATAAAGTGAIVPVGEDGDELSVYNAGANTVSIYPPSGALINTVSSVTVGSIMEVRITQYTSQIFSMIKSA